MKKFILSAVAILAASPALAHVSLETRQAPAGTDSAGGHSMQDHSGMKK